MSMAEQFSAALGDDGQTFETEDEVSFEELAERMGAQRTYSARDHDAKKDGEYKLVDGSRSEYVSDDPIRFEFSDGSAVVMAGAGWDIEGDERYSWQGLVG